MNRASSIALRRSSRQFPGYGYRRVTRELHRRGVPVNHKKVLRIMKQQGLTRKPSADGFAPQTATTRSGLSQPRAEPACYGPNQVWVAITYIGIQSASCTWRSSWTSRPQGRGSAFAHIDTACAWKPRMPCSAQSCRDHPSFRSGVRMRPRLRGHASHHGFRISMSGKGNPYDNGDRESFFKP